MLNAINLRRKLSIRSLITNGMNFKDSLWTLTQSETILSDWSARHEKLFVILDVQAKENFTLNERTTHSGG